MKMHQCFSVKVEGKIFKRRETLPDHLMKTHFKIASVFVGRGFGKGEWGWWGMEWNKVLGLSPSVLGGSTP